MQPEPDATSVLLGAGSLSQALDELTFYRRTVASSAAR